MYRVFSILLSLLIFTSCSSNSVKENNNIFSYNYDFQFYGFESGECVLKGSTVSSLKSVIDSKESAIFMITAPTCLSCKGVVEIVNDISESKDIIIYNIDPYSSLYPVFDTDDFDILLNILKETGINTEKDFYMPIILVINKGKIETYYNEHNDDMNYEELYSKLENIIDKSILIK